MKKILSICCGLSLILLTTACKKENPEVAGTPAENISTQTAPAPVAETTIKSGKVLESMNAAGYTYILVENEAGQTWIAVLETAVKVGDKISYYDGMVMPDFHSKTLNRTFSQLVFSNGLVGQAPPVAPGTEAAAGSPSFAEALSKQSGAAPTTAADAPTTGSSKAIVPFADIKVDKAKGKNSYTIEEIFTKAAELNGKTVKVRGKVMKISAKIMGKNWIHLQDGTGKQEKNTHDLVATTTGPTSDKWDIITVEGVLAADKNFGAGYIYSAIIEEAKISE